MFDAPDIFLHWTSAFDEEFRGRPEEAYLSRCPRIAGEYAIPLVDKDEDEFDEHVDEAEPNDAEWILRILVLFKLECVGGKSGLFILVRPLSLFSGLEFRMPTSIIAKPCSF